MNTKIIFAGIILILVGTFFYHHTPTIESVGTLKETATTTATASPITKTNTTSGERGTLMGTITIGPVCPVEQINHPCLPTPEMYAAAKVLVYKKDKTTLVKTLTPDANGSFSTTLLAGDYFIDTVHQRIGGTTGVPAIIKIVPQKSVKLNIQVDTGIR